MADDELRQRVRAYITANTQKAFLAATDGIDRKTLKSFLDGEHDTRPTKVAKIAATMDELDARASRPHDPGSYVAGLLKHARPETQRLIVEYVEWMVDRENP